MKENKALSLAFVFVQFLTIYLIASTGPIFPSNTLLLLIEIAGLALGGWAILSMGLGNFNITPDIKENSRLVRSGPYKLIRHPMYSALLLTTLPLIINDPSPLRWAFWLLLLVDLLFKLNYEESLLTQVIPDYASYRQKTARLIPRVF